MTYFILKVRHWRSICAFRSLSIFLAFLFFCPFLTFLAENAPNQIRWGILRYPRWRERHSFVPTDNKGEKLAHMAEGTTQERVQRVQLHPSILTTFKR